MDKITFNHGENEKSIQIVLVNDNVKQVESKTMGPNKIDEDDISNEDGPGNVQDVMFRVVIEKPEPNLVKLSRKNVAYITISQSIEEVKTADE